MPSTVTSVLSRMKNMGTPQSGQIISLGLTFNAISIEMNSSRSNKASHEGAVRERKKTSHVIIVLRFN